MSILLRSLMIAGALSAPLAALAEKPPAGAHSHMPTMGEVMEASGVTVGGYIDGSYDFLAGDGVFTSGVVDRVFETRPNGFYLHQAALTLAKQPAEGVGGLVNITTGEDADTIAANGSDGGAMYAGNDNLDVTQAFVQYATGSLTVMAGKFVTMSGAEVINSTANANASRSILFGYAIPFGHTGVRVQYKASDMLTFVGGVNNGWDQQTDLNEQKTGELCLLLTGKAFAFGTVAYIGKEPVVSGPSEDRYLIDAVGSVNATDMLTLVLNLDYGQQKNFDGLDNTATWSGAAGYMNLKLSDTFATSLRAEYFDDKDGFRTGVVQKWKEVTLTTSFTVDKNLSVLPEVRYDFSDQNSFAFDNGTDAKKSQFGGTLKAVYKF